MSQFDKESLKQEVLSSTELTLNVMLLNIYSTHGFKEEAKERYEIINELPISEDQMKKDGEYINFSKFLYSELVENFDAMEKYAYEFMNITKQKAEITGVDMTRAAGLNVAIAKLKKKELDDVPTLLKDAEEIFIEKNDLYTLANTYENYGYYYWELRNAELAKEYLQKALKMYNQIKVAEPNMHVIKQVLLLQEETGIEIDRTAYLERYYAIQTNQKASSESSEVV